MVVVVSLLLAGCAGVEPVPSILLSNAAKPGTRMPATGMGTGCAIGTDDVI